jgi:hypothetical protein
MNLDEVQGSTHDTRQAFYILYASHMISNIKKSEIFPTHFAAKKNTGEHYWEV